MWKSLRQLRENNFVWLIFHHCCISVILRIRDTLATSKAAIDRDLCPNLILDKQSSVIFTYNHCETKQFIFSWLQVLPTNLHGLFYTFLIWCTDIEHPHACSLLSFMFLLNRAETSDLLVNYLYKKIDKSLYL